MFEAEFFIENQLRPVPQYHSISWKNQCVNEHGIFENHQGTAERNISLK